MNISTAVAQASSAITASARMQSLSQAQASLMATLTGKSSQFDADAMTTTATQSLLSHSTSGTLSVLMANPNLLNQVLSYRISEQAKKNTTSSTSTSSTTKSTTTPAYDPTIYQKSDSALQKKYKEMFPDVVDANGKALDKSV